MLEVRAAALLEGEAPLQVLVTLWEENGIEGEGSECASAVSR